MWSDPVVGVYVDFFHASAVSKPQPQSDTGSRRWASGGGTLRQAGSNGSPFEALPRLLQLPPSARMVATAHLQPATTGRRPLLPLLMFLFVSSVDSGSSPSSASCPASPLPSPSTPRTRSPPLPSPSTPRTRSPATSSIPSWPPPLLLPSRCLLPHLNYLRGLMLSLFFWLKGVLQTCAILETVHAAIGAMNCLTPLSLLLNFFYCDACCLN